MKKTGKINYIEIPSRDLEATKAFFISAFNGHSSTMAPNMWLLRMPELMGAFTNPTKYLHPRAVAYWSFFIVRSLRKHSQRLYRQAVRWFRIYSISPAGGDFTSLIQMEMNMLFGLNPMHNQAYQFAAHRRQDAHKLAPLYEALCLKGN